MQDIVGTAESPARPTQVRVAVGLLVAVLVAGQVSPGHVNIRFFFYGHPYYELHRVIATAAIFLAVEVGLIVALAAGRRWALNLYTVWFLIGMLGLAQLATQLARMGHFLWWDICLDAIQAVALVLLFSRPARDWFRAIRPRQVFFDPNTGRQLD